MSQMFLDALTGFTQGAQQAGAVMAQGQAQQVDAAWKNRKLANQERALEEQLLTSQQNRTQSRELHEAGAPARKLGTLIGQSRVDAFDPEQALETAAAEFDLNSMKTNISLRDAGFISENLALKHMGDHKKLMDGLSDRDWLTESGVDTDQFNDALLEHEQNVRFYGKTPTSRDVTGNGGTTKSAKFKDFEVVGNAVKLLNALKPEAGEIENPALLTLRKELAQMAMNTVRGDYQLAEVAKLNGVNATARTFVERLGDRQRAINKNKADSQKVADDKVKALLPQGEVESDGLLPAFNLNKPKVEEATPEVVPTRTAEDILSKQISKTDTDLTRERVTQQREMAFQKGSKPITPAEAIEVVQSSLTNEADKKGMTLKATDLKFITDFVKAKNPKNEIEAKTFLREALDSMRARRGKIPQSTYNPYKF